MISTFPEFKKLEITDKAFIETFLEKFAPYSDFEFSSIWSWDVKEDHLVSQLNDNLVVRFTDYTTGEPFYSFIGTNMVCETAEQLIEYAANKGEDTVLRLVPEITAVAIAECDQFLVEESRDHFDYICELSRYVTLSGNRLKSHRQMVSKFKSIYPDYVVEQLDLQSPIIRKEIADLYRRWDENKGFLMLSEAFAYERFLESSHHFDYVALGIRIEGTLVAFHIATLPAGTHANALFEKADAAHRGIYPAINQEVSKELLKRGYTHLNIEQDLGIETLRRSKMAVDPESFLKKYDISRKQP